MRCKFCGSLNTEAAPQIYMGYDSGDVWYCNDCEEAFGENFGPVADYDHRDDEPEGDEEES